MLALSVQQPWVELIVLGKKRFETRSWRPNYLGPLILHASRNFPERSRQLCSSEPFRSDLAEAGYRYTADLPRGVLLGVVDLVECLPLEAIHLELTAAERDYAVRWHGRWAWRLANPRLLPEPVRCRGQIGLFDIPFFDAELRQRQI